MEDSFTKPVEEVVNYFKTDEITGLTDEQIQRYQEKYGPNGTRRKVLVVWWYFVTNVERRSCKKNVIQAFYKQEHDVTTHLFLLKIYATTCSVLDLNSFKYVYMYLYLYMLCYT